MHFCRGSTRVFAVFLGLFFSSAVLLTAPVTYAIERECQLYNRRLKPRLNRFRTLEKNLAKSQKRLDAIRKGLINNLASQESRSEALLAQRDEKGDQLGHLLLEGWFENEKFREKVLTLRVSDDEAIKAFASPYFKKLYGDAPELPIYEIRYLNARDRFFFKVQSQSLHIQEIHAEYLESLPKLQAYVEAVQAGPYVPGVPPVIDPVRLDASKIQPYDPALAAKIGSLSEQIVSLTARRDAALQELTAVQETKPVNCR